MGWDLLKGSIVFILIIIGFLFLLLLPRELEIEHKSGLVFTASYPFSFEVFQDNVQAFLNHFKTEKGFGENRLGVPIAEEVQKYIKRDLVIIIPAFAISLILGAILGMIQFTFRERFLGKVQAFFSWILSSIPDFFLFISIQYILIKLFQTGFPRFSLYGNDHWYNFIIPMIAILLFPLLHMVKYTASSLENEVGQDYLRTARAKGLKTFSILKHMLWNCLSSLLAQSQFIMLYILSSLPIIEKLSSYQGAGYHLLGSIEANEDPRSLAYILPYLLLMFLTIIISKIVINRIGAHKSGDSL